MKNIVITVDDLFTIAIVNITPELAKKWLTIEINAGNRTTSQDNIDAFAWELQAGEVEPVHQGIAFGPDGRLIDGQHRLMAIIKAGIPALLLVFRYLDQAHADRARVKIDNGRKRTPGHWLELSGLVPKGQGMTAAATVDAIDSIVRGKDIALPEGLVKATYEKHKTAIDAINPTLSKAPAFVRAAFCIAYPINPALIADVASRVNTGAGLQLDTGAYRINQEIAASKGVKKPESFKSLVIARVLRCLQAEIEGTKIQAIPLPKHPRAEGKPEKYKVIDWFIARRFAAGLDTLTADKTVEK